MKKTKGLGQGLNAFFENEEHTALVTDEQTEREEDGIKIYTVALTDIEPNKNQPRKTFEKEALEELTSSIIEHGIITPIIIRRMPSGRYEIIAGERRWRAARMAGLREIPVIIKEMDNCKAAEIALIENLQREDLNIIEEALGYKSLMDEYKFTQEQVSKSVGKPRPSIANALRILNLPKDVLEMLKDAQISAGHAKILVSLGEQASKVAQQIVQKDLSVRQTEKLAKTFIAGAKFSRSKQTKMIFIQELERQLSEALKRKVFIQHGNKKGKLEIEYYGNEDLENLINCIKNI